MVPWILPTSSEKLALANAFCIMPMTIRPGAMKAAKGTPITVAFARPSATVKMMRVQERRDRRRPDGLGLHLHEAP